MDKPLLSICIPAYNRPDYLRITLQSITAQFSEPNVRDLVEVVVSDDGGSAEIPGVVRSFQDKFSNIIYTRNQAKPSIDTNVFNAVAVARGKYCWYLGDDDLLETGSLKYILHILQQQSIAVLTIEVAAFTGQEGAGKIKVWDNSPVVYCKSFDEFFQKYCPGILSVLMFDRQLWLSIEHPSYTPEWAYYEIVLKMLPKAGDKLLAHVAAPLVLAGQDCAWNRNGKELTIFLDWKNLLASLGGYGFDKSYIDSQLRDVFPKTLLLIMARAKGHDLPYSSRIWKRVYREFSYAPLYLWASFVIFLTPNIFIKILRDTNKAVRSLLKGRKYHESIE